jgi:hypothetical protein
MRSQYQTRAQNFEFEKPPEVYFTRLLVVYSSTIVTTSDMAEFCYTFLRFVGTTTISYQMITG